MGKTDLPLLNLIQKVRSWISSVSVFQFQDSPMTACFECRVSFPVPFVGHRCRDCGRLFCRKCMQISVNPPSDGGGGGGGGGGTEQPPMFCRFCYRAITGHLDAPDSPLPKSGNSSHFSSSPRSISCRSDEEEDADKHLLSPRSEVSQDASDVDSVSISTGLELYSFKSVNSSPFHSPSRVGAATGDNNSNTNPLDGEAHGDFRKTGAAVQDFLENSNDPGYDNLSVYRNHETQKTEQPFDLENNRRIWDPPLPEDEKDDAESGLFGYDDDDDDVGDSALGFSSGSFSGDALSVREKPSGANKEHLRDAVHGHFRALVAQLLKGEGIRVGGENGREGWLEIASSLAWQAATFVKPDTSKGDSMDPGNYVKVKCILSGSPGDSTLVKGVVCTKNVKHKRMVSQHKNPRLFLLGGALEYQRVSTKLASINTVLEQEIDHIKMSVSKIEAHKPNVVLVEKSVSSYAQEHLLTKEISLVLNVKRSLLERIGRCTGAEIASSVDNITSARVGHCEMFRVEKIFEECSSSNRPNKRSSKTLMFFEGCPRRLGCTVLLRGTNFEELKKVKHVVQFASFAAYHLSRETSFLADEGATLPRVPTGSPIAVPAKLTNADICISKNSTPPNVCQADIDRHQNLDSCSNHGINCFLPSSDVASQSRIANSGDISCLSSADSQLNGDFAAYSFYSPPNEMMEDSFEERKNLINHWQIGAVNEEKTMDTDDGKDSSTEYFSSSDSQSILVSLSSTCVLKGCVCEPSQLYRIKFYGSFDKPLGKYLREDLFDQASSCRSCREPVEAHVRCYTHQHGSLTISVKRIPSLKLPGERDGRIWMWHRCLKCELKDGIPPAAHRVVMSNAAWGLSFGKFLELSFSNHATANRLASCGHSLQKDCLRFYGFGSMVAFFRYSPADILSVHLPPLVLDFTCQIQQDWARREAAAISSKIEILHSEVFDVLQGMEQKIVASEFEPINTSIHKHILELKNMLKRERDEYDVVLQLTTEETSSSQKLVDILELNRLRRCLLIDSQSWNRRLCLLDSFSKTEDSASKLSSQFPEVATQTTLKEQQSEMFCKNEKVGDSTEQSITKCSTLSEQHKELSLQVLECNSNNLVEMGLSIESVEGSVGPAGFNLVSDQCYRAEDVRQIGAEACKGTSLERAPSAASILSDKIDLAWTGYPEADSVRTISLMDNPSYRKVISPVRVNSFDSGLRFRDRVIHGRSASASLHLSSVRSFDASGGLTYVDYSQGSPSSARKLTFNSSHSTVFISSTSMVGEGARLLLPQTSYDDIVIVLYDNEPTTIISYAISSQEHANFITCENDKINGFGRPAITQFQSDEDPQRFRGNSFLDPKESHFRISFDDESSADKVKFSVTCYFAKQFDALRKKCCPNEADFLRSLSRCKRWNAQGGKSNVYFAKSFDERFVIKQVTKTELDSFEDFASEYFNYLTDCINSGSPTSLAKVLGIYQVTVKHLKGGREVKMDLMVMENLFFGRSLSRVYDLKGSSRSRYNPDTSGSNSVLLDLNLLESLRKKPIFLGSKAKRSLDRAVWNDTNFLASVDVMDYSLLVGVDDERKELVIGIIDFMRQYTWDKHLETWVKASGILGGPKNALPTVISPLQYKKRFRKAMSKYFLTVPDQWSSS